ncbi:MAG: glucose-6-phosphate isomerase [Myxococcales bacterium]|nr:glucose-6-phosphate isomerase [Myxococcales bacterium]
MKSARQLWEVYRQTLSVVPELGLSIDTSRMDLPESLAESLPGLADRIARAHREMAAVERGDRVNSDEDRMVGHYWLRAPELAPTPEIRRAIEETVVRVKRFAGEVHVGKVRGERATFTDVLVVGIGGSALGPQFVAQALASAADPMRTHFIDNTDPDGIDRVFTRLGDGIERTLTVVISKSGGTKETRNGMLEAGARYRAAGLAFARHAIAVTGDGSELDRTAAAEGWIDRFPMWDWVGGRTSELSAVGLLPAALAGFDVDGLLAGARTCDVATRREGGPLLANPALALALSWYVAGDGRGTKDMVILPYKDRLELLSKYLQQLVMESLGKERDRDGNVVHQGIAVYGNKGSTDQHAYVQQLRDGVQNFFVTFVEVLRDRAGRSPEVEEGVTSGDFLSGFLQGTRRALYENGRGSITITIPTVEARTIGALIALYERAVGFYAAMVNVNAYHQPGVESGKRAAGAVIALQRSILGALRVRTGSALTVEEMAGAIGAPDEAEVVLKILEHLAANPDHGVRASGSGPFDRRYAIDSPSV